MTEMGRLAWSEPEKASAMTSRIPLGHFAGHIYLAIYHRYYLYYYLSILFILLSILFILLSIYIF